MAFISQDTKKKIATALKAAGLPKDLKYSLAINHHSSLVVTIRQAPAYALDDFSPREEMPEDYLDYMQVNTFHIDTQFKGKTRDFLNKIVSTIKEAGEWFDKSDTMTDYFHTAFYIDVNFGRWDKPCEFVGERKSAESTTPDALITEEEG